VRHGGAEEWTALGRDIEAIRAFSSERAEALGSSLVELRRPLPAGHPSETETARYDLLARIVYEARERGAAAAAIGSVTGRPRARVSELAERGD